VILKFLIQRHYEPTLEARTSNRAMGAGTKWRIIILGPSATTKMAMEVGKELNC
jgi:hypothetical protein